MDRILNINELLLENLGFVHEELCWKIKKEGVSVVPEIHQEGTFFYIPTDKDAFHGLQEGKNLYRRFIKTQGDLFDCYTEASVEQFVKWI